MVEEVDGVTEDVVRPYFGLRFRTDLRNGKQATGNRDQQSIYNTINAIKVNNPKVKEAIKVFSFSMVN